MSTSAPPAVPFPGVPTSAPPGFHLLAKPSGSTCNIDCTYCFFLSKEALYPNEKSRMSAATLEAYIRQLLESHQSPEVTVAWQGGEPTLMRLEFFQRAVELVEQYRRPGQTIQHTFQTNGILLDDAWCEFFKQHDFLIGLSVDGPRELHDTYRRDRLARGTFDKVMNGWRLLRRHRVDFNVLCTVNAANEHHGRTVYRFFRDELEATWVQFIPIVERANEETLALANQGWREQPGRKRLLYTQTGNLVTERTVGAEQYGRFMIDVFEEWIRHDIGTVYVQLFDVTLEAFFGRHLLCIHAPTCGNGPVLEHNGDLYSCDHFVEPEYLLGNIHETHMVTLVAKPEQRKFGARQTGHAHDAVPGVQGPSPLQRRVPERPFLAVAYGRARSQLPVSRPRAVLHAHRPGVLGHGPAAPAEPCTVGGHGERARRRRPTRAVRPVPVRQRTGSSASATVRRHRAHRSAAWMARPSRRSGALLVRRRRPSLAGAHPFDERQVATEVTADARRQSAADAERHPANRVTAVTSAPRTEVQHHGNAVGGGVHNADSARPVVIDVTPFHGAGCSSRESGEQTQADQARRRPPTGSPSDQVEDECRRPEADGQVRQHRVQRMAEPIATQERPDPTSGKAARRRLQQVGGPVQLDGASEFVDDGIDP